MPVIVFDFFGVICSEIAPFVLPRYMSPEAAIAYKATIVQDADLGKITQAEMFEKLGAIARAPAAQLEAEFWAHVKIDAAMVALIERLRKTHRTALLSNAIIPFVRQIFAQHDLERLFETIVVSAEVGLAKPDPAIYRHMAVKLGVPAGDCFFIDDNPANVAAAQSVGMQAVVFEGVEKLQRDLTAVL